MEETPVKGYLSAAAATALLAGAAFAQGALPDNLAKLGAFNSTGVTEFWVVEQGGDLAKGIKKILERITLPGGFKIELYAVVPDARHMAVGPQGIVTSQPFAEGWIDENGEYLGRPVDVVELRDGSILVSDDLAGALYRISYSE